MSEVANETTPNIVHATICDGCGTVLEETQDHISDDEFAAKRKSDPDNWYLTKPSGSILYRHITEQKSCRWC